MGKGSPRGGARAAAKARGDKYYETGKPCKWDHMSKRYAQTGSCVQCDYERNKRYIAENPDKKREYQKRDYTNSRERIDGYHVANRESILERQLQSRRSKPEYYRKASRNWWVNNKDKANATRAVRRRRVREALVSWADTRKMRDIYLLRPKDHHVDHIIPLNGTNSEGMRAICGLHIETNLQYLPSAANMTKHTRWSEDGSKDPTAIVPFSWEHFLVISEQA